MTLFSKGNIYIMLFIAIGVAYVVFLVYQNLYANQKEHFEEPVNDKQYKANLQVIKVFDVVLGRKPTNDELEKYGTIDNEQDILLAVMNDFKDKDKTKDTNLVDKAKSVGAAVVAATKEKMTEEPEPSEAGAEVEPEPVKSKSSGISNAVKEAYDNVVNDDRVCMNKRDVMDMLTNISEQVKAFKSMVK